MDIYLSIYPLTRLTNPATDFDFNEGGVFQCVTWNAVRQMERVEGNEWCSVGLKESSRTLRRFSIFHFASLLSSFSRETECNENLEKRAKNAYLMWRKLCLMSFEFSSFQDMTMTTMDQLVPTKSADTTAATPS
mmetsp:Transcript_6713/g.10499  ORF Transcript_6713/g.10499 Transcript_6713/m.10499 type:complete len:134 (-) Transcript_6713:360-761(-)